MNAKTCKAGINLLKKNSVKAEFVGGIVATGGVAYTWEYLTPHIWAISECGVSEGEFSIPVRQEDFSSICKGNAKSIEFKNSPENGGYYTDGYPYIYGDGDIEFDILAQEGESIFKGRLNLPSRDEIIGLTDPKNPKRSLNVLCWDLKTGNYYASDTKILGRGKAVALSVGVEHLLLPPKVLNYLTENECEIFTNEKFVIIKQGGVRVIIAKADNANFDKPPLFEKVIPGEKKMRGQIAMNRDYLSKLLKDFRNEYARIKLCEGGAVRIVDYDPYSKTGKEFVTDSEQILHNASIDDDNESLWRVDALKSICKFATDDFILVDVFEGEIVKATEYSEGSKTCPFEKSPIRIKAGADRLVVMMPRIL